MWKLEVAGCFGDIDIMFATHPLDRQRAITCIDDAKADGADYDDFAREVVWYCYQHVTDDLKPHIDKQLERLKQLWS